MIELDVDLDELIKTVVAIAEENPDFVYKDGIEDDEGAIKCFYERNNKPSCIIGRALHRLGIHIGILRRMDNAESIDEAHSTGIYEFLDGDEVKILWLETVQREQDNLVPYGACVRSADHEARRRFSGWERK